MNARRIIETVIVLSLLVTSAVPAEARSARQLYTEAEAALKRGDSERAISLGTEARARLGSTNPRIEGLLAQAYFDAGDPVAARIAMDKLLRLVPPSRQEEPTFASYRALDTQITRALQRAQKEHEEKEEEADRELMREAEEVVRRHEAKRRQKVEQLERQNQRKRRRIYEHIRATGDTDAMREFARAYSGTPEGEAIGDEAAKIEAIRAARERERQRLANEPTVWREARRKDTPDSYRNYLRIYPEGRYVTEAREGMYQARAASLFAHARRSGKLSSYVSYVENFPRGHDYATARKIVADTYLREGDRAFDDKNWGMARRYYKKHVHYAESPSDKARRRLRKSDRTWRQSDYHGIAFTYGGRAPGLIIQKAHPDAWGIYGGAFGWLFTGTELDGEVDFPQDQDSLSIPLDADGDGKDVYTRTGEHRNGGWGLRAGVTRKIIYPLWHVIGLGRAKELALTGTPISADEAYRIGLVSAVHPDETLLDEGMRFAENLARRPPRALFDTKRLGRDLIEMDTDSALTRMFEVISERLRSDEHQVALERYVASLGRHGST